MNAYHISLIGLVCIVLLLAGCKSQKSEWQHAQQKNTVEAYQKYTKDYPNGKHVDDANKQIAHIKEQREKQQARADWQSAKQMNTPRAYQQFLQKHSDSQYADEAKQRIQQVHAEQDWRQVQQSNDPEALQAFISHYPNSPQAEQAHQELTRLQQEKKQKQQQAKEKQAKQQKQKQQAAKKPQGDYLVQLAAFSKQARAKKAEQQMEKKLGDQLNGTSLKVYSPPSGSSLYRLGTTAMSHDDASSLCKSLKKNDTDCFVTKRPSH
jgi:outer membrane protein assembly factor BamD (BamD/ComL family)